MATDKILQKKKKTFSLKKKIIRIENFTVFFLKVCHEF